MPVYCLGRLRERAAVAWDWTRQRTRARLALPWWGRGNVKGEFSVLHSSVYQADCLRTFVWTYLTPSHVSAVVMFLTHLACFLADNFFTHIHTCTHTCHVHLPAATQSTQTLEDEDDDQYSTPSLLQSGQLDFSALQQAHPPLNPELISKLQKLARKRSTSQAQRQFIRNLLTLYLQQVSSPVESEEDSARFV